MKLNTLYKSVVEYTDIKLCTRRTHAYIRPHKTLTSQFYAMRVIVQNIGDNSRTLHVLLAYVFSVRCLLRGTHSYVSIPIVTTVFTVLVNDD
jgi:hypothetical protein